LAEVFTLAIDDPNHFPEISLLQTVYEPSSLPIVSKVYSSMSESKKGCKCFRVKTLEIKT